MGTPAGIVAIYNQKRRLPAKTGFYIDVAILGDVPFGVNSRVESDPLETDLIETVSTNVQELIAVEIFSCDDSARLRRREIIFALACQAAQNLQERYAFKIGRVPTSFVDASEIEGAARLNRYVLTFNVLRAYSQSNAVATYTEIQNPPQKILVNP